MKPYHLDQIKKYTKRPGFSGGFVHGDSLSLTHWTLEKGAVLAWHSHPHEQMSFVVSGKMQFDRTGQEALIVEAGDFVVFSPNEPHGGLVLEESVVIDAFSPVREDFKKEMEDQERARS